MSLASFPPCATFLQLLQARWLLASDCRETNHIQRFSAQVHPQMPSTAVIKERHGPKKHAAGPLCLDGAKTPV